MVVLPSFMLELGEEKDMGVQLRCARAAFGPGHPGCPGSRRVPHMQNAKAE